MTAATTAAPSVRDQVIAAATSLPDLIQKASVLDPALAAALNANATAASKTPIGALVAGAVGLLATKYGFGWPEAMDDLIAGALVLIGGYVTHAVQAHFAKPFLTVPATTGAAT